MKRFWIINLILFQATWVCSAFFTAQAPFVTPLLVIIHFLLSPTRHSDLKILVLLPLGLLLDSLMLHFGVFAIDPAIANQSWFPVWLVCLWIMFLISFNHSLNWLLKCSKVILFALGFVAGTSSYWGGIKAGALLAAWPDASVVAALALSWGIFLPLLVAAYSNLMKPTMARTTR
ncbi:conserved membrane hypothetical protein [Vibrio chagasii]|uniref:DUF2878 domain-containing protein n=1 Tax=Vibrio chagasii TaxID=170679 RepID=UPI00163FD06A|nr:DUF2878 domain-containing protein [Vibrio chagasii]MCG9672694.1 DUF2878 domain-containing protein [Vibrio chagasii]CAH6837994.1 conserved membrane hypothetical protein [Vibrio chagasii]CAH6838794.1 conserved membrane hypothetical protein [Vibrio chagasii]CAH6848069.1 conserved membrane hypothetical protein [Vibrio chagasii]CAH6852060.1 conserved membrane hypothetical protein [Vibrio chagasii]